AGYAAASRPRSRICMPIAPNQLPGVGADLCRDTFPSRMSREHNNANVLALAGRLTDADVGCAILKVWLESHFAGGRHARRVDKIKDMEGRLGVREDGR